MRQYETTFILRPNLGEEQTTEIIDRTVAIITGDEGSALCLDRWGVKRLAYEINKEIQGYYVYLNYAAPGKTVDEIERIFRIDDRVLRYLTVKLGDNMTAETIEAEKQRNAANERPQQQHLRQRSPVVERHGIIHGKAFCLFCSN